MSHPYTSVAIEEVGTQKDKSTSWALRRRCTDQARILLSGLGEICGTVDEGTEIARRCGEASAQTFGPLAAGTLADLEAQLNEVLSLCDWGYVTVQDNDDCISIALSEYPALNEVTGNAETFVFAFMEGFLGALVSELSGSSALGLSVEVRPGHMREPLIMRFGRQD